MADPRFAALTILNLYQPQKTNLSLLMSGFLGRAEDLKDRGLVRDLVWGVVRNLNTIDWLIGIFARKPGSLEPAVRNVLRLGVFQIAFFGDRVPAYAAVSESVELARRIGRSSAAAMVNAVLRGVQRKKDRLPWPEEGKDPAKALAIRCAHPEWMVARWLRRQGREAALRRCEADNAPAPLAVRVNTLKISREALRETLEQEGVPSESARFSSDGLILGARPEIEKLESFRKGLFLVQDEASQLVSLMLGASAGETLLDLCCGAGIKASHLAQLAGGKARIIAVDLSAGQLGKAKENFARMGVPGVETRQADARSLSGITADRVLLDAPCSGLGVIRRKPDIKWNRTPGDVTRRYPALQGELLAHAASLVKAGGTLLYSTCSTEPEEDEDAVRKFLGASPDFSVEAARPPAGEQRLVTPEGFFRSFPDRDGMDGFFAAKLVKHRR